MPDRPRIGRPPGADADATRARIVRSARAAFGRQGYRHATPAAIAKDAGIARSMLYRYFPTKRDLYVATFEDFRDNVMRQLTREWPDDPGAPNDRLAAVLRTAARMNREDPGYAQFVMSTLIDGGRDPELMTTSVGVQAGELRSTLREVVDAAFDAGEVRAPADRAAVTDMLLLILWGTAVFGSFIGSEDETEKAVEAAADLVEGRLFRAGQEVPGDRP